MHLNGENYYTSNIIKQGKLAETMQMDRRFMFMKKKNPQGVVCPWPGVYTCIHVNIAPGYIHDHNIQTFYSLEPLGQSKPNILGVMLGRRKEHLY